MQPIEQLPADVVQIANEWAAGYWVRRLEALLADVPDVTCRRDFLDFFNERAGICEFDGCLPRFVAEQVAFELLVRHIEESGISFTG